MVPGSQAVTARLAAEEAVLLSLSPWLGWQEPCHRVIVFCSPCRWRRLSLRTEQSSCWRES